MAQFSKNHVTLIGNLGMDPETKVLESGRKLCRFTLATSETYTDAEGQKVNETTWHNVVAWNQTAIFAETLKKGNGVILEGKIVYRAYEDKHGVTKYVTEIIASDILKIQSQIYK